jgi:hypothetical protein
MVRLPNELLLLIYKFAEPHTRLNMNKVLGWSYRVANPFMGKQIVPFYPIHHKIIHKQQPDIFNYVMRGH